MNPAWTPRVLLMLVLPPLLWAGNSVLGRVLVSELPPLALNGARWLLACLLLLPFGWRVWQRPEALRRRWGYLCILGLLGVGCYNALQYAALRTSTAINVTLIAASMPVWMLLLGALFYRVRPRAVELLGVVLSVLGVAVVLSRGQWAVLRHVTFVEGDLLMMLAVLVWAVYSWLLVRPPAHMQGVQRPDWNWAQLLLPQVMFGTLWAGLAAAVEASVWTPPASTGQGLHGAALVLALLYVAIGPSIVAFRCWGLGVATVGPAVAAFFANLTPLFTALLSAALLGEAPQPYHGLAFGLMVLGIGLSAWRAPAPRGPQAKPSPSLESTSSPP